MPPPPSSSGRRSLGEIARNAATLQAVTPPIGGSIRDLYAEVAARRPFGTPSTAPTSVSMRMRSSASARRRVVGFAALGAAMAVATGVSVVPHLGTARAPSTEQAPASDAPIAASLGPIVLGSQTTSRTRAMEVLPPSESVVQEKGATDHRDSVKPVSLPSAAAHVAAASVSARAPEPEPQRTSPAQFRAETDQAPNDASPAQPFDKEAARSAVAEAAQAARQCGDGSLSGQAPVAITFAPSGRATVAVIRGDSPFRGTKTGGCIARRMRSVVVPAFAGQHVTVSSTLFIP
jgi:hypothetical protein